MIKFLVILLVITVFILVLGNGLLILWGTRLNWDRDTFQREVSLCKEDNTDLNQELINASRRLPEVIYPPEAYELEELPFNSDLYYNPTEDIYVEPPIELEEECCRDYVRFADSDEDICLPCL